MPRYTGPVNFVLDAIREGKSRHNNRLHVSVDYNKEYYTVTHWYSKIAIGHGRELPDMMNLHGWTSATTLNLLNALGFCLQSMKIKYGKPWKNEKTGRMNHNRGSVMHLNGRPLLGMNGEEPDYASWYSKDGLWITDNFEPY